jgi:uncharacterized protein YchJ
VSRVTIITVPINEQAPVDLRVNAEHEIEVTPNKLTLPKKAGDPKKESEDARRELENAKKDESTYAGLYHHIQEWAEKKRTGVVEEDVMVQQNKKVGRNETCPCGSGKKFKTCHGRA